MENLLIIIAGVAIILAISYAVFNFFCVKKLEEGTEKMGDIAGAIRIGANAFIKYEYKLVAIIGAVIAVLVLVVIRRGYERIRGLGRNEDSHLRQRTRYEHRTAKQGPWQNA